MKNKIKKTTIYGFTLIELLVVMAILAILSGIGLGSFMSAQKKGRDTRRKEDLKSIAKALEAYYNDNNEYPEDNNGLIIACGLSSAPNACNWGEAMKFSNKDTTYMVRLPKDPVAANHYYYESDKTKWVLYAKLENTKDKDIAKDNEGNPTTYKRLDDSDNTNCGEIACNYAITSTNLSTADLSKN